MGVESPDRSRYLNAFNRCVVQTGSAPRHGRSGWTVAPISSFRKGVGAKRGHLFACYELLDQRLGVLQVKVVHPLSAFVAEKPEFAVGLGSLHRLSLEQRKSNTGRAFALPVLAVETARIRWKNRTTFHASQELACDGPGGTTSDGSCSAVSDTVCSTGSESTLASGPAGPT